MIRPPQRSTLFPYTTLFRSSRHANLAVSTPAPPLPSQIGPFDSSSLNVALTGMTSLAALGSTLTLSSLPILAGDAGDAVRTTASLWSSDRPPNCMANGTPSRGSALGILTFEAALMFDLTTILDGIMPDVSPYASFL